MEESTQREKVLKRVRNSLISKTNNPFPNPDFDSNIYPNISDSLEIKFAEEFINASGNFIFCESEQELTENLNALNLENHWHSFHCKEEKIKNILTQAHLPYLSEEVDFPEIEVGITLCEYLVARTGSIMVSSKQLCGRKMFVFPPIHIVIAYTSQLVPDIKNALLALRKKYEDKIPSLVSFITGPSRTADIEKTLVMGMHGPKEVYLFLIDDTVYE